MKSRLWIINCGVLLCIVTPGRTARAQFQVTTSGGTDVSSESGRLTSVSFVGKSADDHIPIYNISAQSDSVAFAVSSSGAFVSGSAHGESSTRLCDTPCRLDVRPGAYRLRAGDNVLLSKKIDLNLSGGEVAYRVREASPVGFFFGMFFTVCGVGFGMVGALDLANGGDVFGETGAAVMVGGAAAALLTGIILLAARAWGRATKISSPIAEAQLGPRQRD